MEQSRYKQIIKIIVVAIIAVFYTAAFSAQNTEGIQVYQKNMHLFEEHKQNLAADIYRYNNANNLLDELRQEFILPHYEDNPLVQEQVRWFLNHEDFLVNSVNRAAPYLYYIAKQVRKRHLPPELVLLPIMESSYNPFAYSNRGAAGIWQMMPGTATGFGIKQDSWYDGRRDVVASTRAALDYLAYLGNFFDGNWLLAIAAYDTGEGNVLSAIRRNISDGRNTDFWSLPLAQETRIYIPRLMALAIIISHPERYRISFPAVSNAPYLAQIDMGGQIDLKHAAELAGLSLKKLMHLNPGYNRTTTHPHVPTKLVLPIEHVQRFAENLAHSPFHSHHSISTFRYKIKHGDTIFSVAKKFHTSTISLRKANPTLASTLKPGKHMLIPRSTVAISKAILESNQTYMASSENVTIDKPKKAIVFKKNKYAQQVEQALENYKGKYKLRSGDTLYMVRVGDDLSKIAKKFHTSVKTLASINSFSSSKHVHPGERLIIPTHLAKNNASQKYKLSSGDTIYMVRKGDNIEKIAKKFKTTASAIRLVNILSSNHLQEGDRLVIPTHVG